jgi:hypothetical protein
VFGALQDAVCWREEDLVGGCVPWRQMEGDDVVDEADLPVPSFQSQVAFWFSVWSADRPELVEQARATADPERDPWGYLAALGELLAAAA